MIRKTEEETSSSGEKDESYRVQRRESRKKSKEKQKLKRSGTHMIHKRRSKGAKSLRSPKHAGELPHEAPNDNIFN